VPEFDATSVEDEWVNAIQDGQESRGSFEEVAALARPSRSRNIALRVPYKRLLGMHSECSSRIPRANAFVHREQYRQGWDTLIG